MTLAHIPPLSLSELLDRTFTYYRNHFWVFVGIMAIPQVFVVALNLLMTAITALPGGAGAVPTSSAPGGQFAAFVAAFALGTFAMIMVYFSAYAAALGASTFAVSEFHLGRTLSIRAAFARMHGHTWKLIKLFLLIVILMALCAVTIILLPVAVLMVLWYLVAVPALLLENIRPVEALKRSAFLTKGFRGRAFLILLLTVMISWTATSIFQGPFLVVQFLLAYQGGAAVYWLNALSVVAGSVGQALSAPLLMIAVALYYYDLRVRKEGFDLQLMMAALDQKESPPEARDAASSDPGPRLEKSSVLLTVLLSLVTLGIYFPVWYLMRRRAINTLRSPEKLSLVPLAGALALYVLAFSWGFASGVLSQTGRFSSARSFAGLGNIAALASGIILVFQSFKVRRILLDHFSTPRSDLFSAGISTEREGSFSGVATFFLGIFYLQYKINEFLETAGFTPVGDSLTSRIPS